MWTQNPAGESLVLQVTEDQRGEARFVAEQIVRLHSVEQSALWRHGGTVPDQCPVKSH